MTFFSDDFLFIGGKLWDRIKLQEQFSIGATLICAEDQHICAHLQSDKDRPRSVLPIHGGPPGQPGAGGRTTAQGYTAGDNVWQKFTSKERDTETGLDYFLARYYSDTNDLRQQMQI